MEILSTISGFIFSGFLLTTIFLFPAYWIFSTHRPIFRKLIILSYIYLIIGSFIFLVFSIRQILSYSGGNDEWEKYAFTNKLWGSYCFAYWGTTLFKGFLPQILWIKKIRKSVWTSIILVPFLLIDFYMPLLFSTERTYLPSSKTMYFDFLELFFYFMIFVFLLTITFILTRKKIVV
jgi:hypothetical protein